MLTQIKSFMILRSAFFESPQENNAIELLNKSRLMKERIKKMEKNNEVPLLLSVGHDHRQIAI